MPEWYAEKVLCDTRWDGSIPVRLTPILQYYGLEWRFVKMRQHGGIITLGGRAIIFLNEDLPMTAKRFRAAHELGHWILHSSRIGSNCPFCVQDEYEVNRFAAALLCPKAPFTDALQKLRDGIINIDEIANRFGVGKAVIVNRTEEITGSIVQDGSLNFNDRPLENEDVKQKTYDISK